MLPNVLALYSMRTFGLSWSSHDSLIYHYTCNQCISPPIKLWARIPLMAGCIRYNIVWYSLSLAYGIMWYNVDACQESNVKQKMPYCRNNSKYQNRRKRQNSTPLTHMPDHFPGLVQEQRWMLLVFVENKYNSSYGTLI